MEYAQLIIVAILVEALWENIKMIYQNKKIQVSAIASLILGIFICIVASVDIFPLIGLNCGLPIVGCVLTGIIVSRGANFVSDLFTKLKGE